MSWNISRPMPTIACNWYEYHHLCAKKLCYTYHARMQLYRFLAKEFVAILEIINLDKPKDKLLITLLLLLYNLWHAEYIKIILALSCLHCCSWNMISDMCFRWRMNLSYWILWYSKCNYVEQTHSSVLVDTNCDWDTR